MRNDIRDAFRRLRSTPGFTLVALAVLTLGIGAGTAIFSIVDAVVLRGLPYDESDRMVWVGLWDTKTGKPRASQTPQDFLMWNGYMQVFDSITAATTAGGFLLRDEVRPSNLYVHKVTDGFFDVFGTVPRLGRPLGKEDASPGRERVIVISDSLWRGRFGGTKDVIGKTLTVDSGAWEIVGVMPSDFVYPPDSPRMVDAWIPYVFQDREKQRGNSRSRYLQVTARLKAGVSVEEAQARVGAGVTALREEYPKWFTDAEGRVLPLRKALVGTVGPWMLMLLGAVGFVLLIACVNVANLMLTRATVRSREIQIRAALGACGWQIARGLLVESLLLSAAGTVAGVCVALWGVYFLRSVLPEDLPRISAVSVDLRVLAVAAAVSVITGIFFGLVPAFQFARPDLSTALREGGHGSAGAGRQRARSLLLVAEVALAMMLLVGAGLFMMSFIRVVGVDLGLDYRHVLTVWANPRSSASEMDPASTRSFREASMRETIERIRSMPGVQEVGLLTGGLPMSGNWSTIPVYLEGREEPFDGDDSAHHRDVTPSYRPAMGVRLLKGRYIEETDTADSPLVAVLNQEAVRRYFAGQEALGARIRMGPLVYTVVGVVADVRLFGPERPALPEVYGSFWQQNDIHGGDMIIRTQGDPESLAKSVSGILWSNRPDWLVPETRTMESYYRRLIVQREFNMLLVSLFGILAIVIAAVGIYGVIAYSVTQRIPEIGLRMALGARPKGVMGLILGRAAAFLSLGLAAGLGSAWLLANFIQSFLFQVESRDLWIYAGAAGVLALCGLLAAFVPARRAASVDPLIALRAE